MEPTPEDRIILDQVETARKEIKTDNYQMSIGEAISLYKEKEIKLNPAYQRLFRWEDDQKTNFIESLIIGIPIPPIFVAQKEDGKWDVVDGVQRLSTIFQLTGDLEGKPPLTLTSCKYIPAIEGRTWETLPSEIQRILKRSKITVNIILTENSVQSQYEVFQRLNTGGIHLSDQEIRNCLIIMNNEGFYDRIEEFKNHQNFIIVTPMSDEKIQEEYRMELILRYLIAKAGLVDFTKYKVNSTLIKDFIDKETLTLISSEEFDLNAELGLLGQVSDFLAGHLQENAFEKYVEEKETFEGKFSYQVFEAVLPGLVSNFHKVRTMTKDQIREHIRLICLRPEFVAATGRGVKALKRYKDLTSLSLTYFGDV